MKQNEIIYQIFPRNYSTQKPFVSIQKDLDQIKDLGATIVYLMPIHEIGIKNRKGTYGSPYAIRDYFSISNDLGSKEEFISLVNSVHEKGMKIILDMVFNHTSPDNVLLPTHENYYFHKNGKLGNRVGDWSDIVDLDNNKEETQKYLLSVLKYWVSLGVNGFRFDVASMIPLTFFKLARKELGNDIIFIAESIDVEFFAYLKSIGDNPTPDLDLFPTFDALYNYNWFRCFHKYINGKESLKKLVSYINEDDRALRVLCLENHDNDRISSHLNNTQLSKWLDFLSFIKGDVFIYAGEEYGNKHKPELFELDPVDWSYVDKESFNLYKKYINNKKSQKQIKTQRIEVIDDRHVKVEVQYIDNSKEIKEFELPTKKDD